MLATITIKDLKITCIIGIHPEERNTAQAIFLDIDLDYDIKSAAENDDVRFAVDYHDLSQLLEQWLKERRFKLLESLAEKSCSMIFERWPEIKRCKIKVKKPGAVPEARHAALTVERTAP
ncbi:dihydroneopterin aldolase [Fibrobacterota bacterium]